MEKKIIYIFLFVGLFLASTPYLSIIIGLNNSLNQKIFFDWIGRIGFVLLIIGMFYYLKPQKPVKKN